MVPVMLCLMAVPFLTKKFGVYKTNLVGRALGLICTIMIAVTGYAGNYWGIVYGIRKEPYIAVMRMNRNGQTSSKTAWMFKDNVACWTWNGYEGQEASVDVYSNAEEVELFLNGRSLGREKTGEENDFTATYQVEYQPGVLKAVSYENGQETGICDNKTGRFFGKRKSVRPKDHISRSRRRRNLAGIWKCGSVIAGKL